MAVRSLVFATGFVAALAHDNAASQQHGYGVGTSQSSRHSSRDVQPAVSQAGANAAGSEKPAQDDFAKYMQTYLPPGDESYTGKWVGSNSSWRGYMGSHGDYTKYLSQYGGPQADYDQYVSLYSSMAGPSVTSGNNYNGKGKQQLSAWNATMTKTYDTYIPPAYEQFAEESTEARTEQGGGGMPHQGGQQQPHQKQQQQRQQQQQQGGSGQSAWGPPVPLGGSKGGQRHFYESEQDGHHTKVGYERFAGPYVREYATDEGAHNAFDYEGKEFASGGMEMGGVQDYAEYMEQYAGEWVPSGSVDGKADKKDAADDAKTQDKRHGKRKDSKQDKSQDKKKDKKQDKKHDANHDKMQDKIQDQKQDKMQGKVQDSHHAKMPAAHYESAKKNVTSRAPEEDDSNHSSPAAQALVLSEALTAQLGAAANDNAYAAWAVSRQRPIQTADVAAAKDAEQSLTLAMRKIQETGGGAVDEKSLHELEDASRAASSAIDRMQQAETDAVRTKAVAAHKACLKAARRWRAAAEAQAAKARREAEELAKGQASPKDAASARAFLLRSEASAREAQEAGLRLEKSLGEALGVSTQKAAEEVLQRADDRRALLRGLLSQTAESAEDRLAGSAPLVAPVTEADQPALRGSRLNARSESSTVPNLSLLSLTRALTLQAVPGNMLIAVVSVGGVLSSIVGFIARRRRESRRASEGQMLEVALLSLS
eukprot:gb/GFBE01080102.1/.p1 GENE.gb/GFBE01080102.1/~~gb/GFBE01080102.1/.p1  ORF type:complete len:709 (+),score=177.10 gb/GFBE01080102.1/:1-2127(+)